MTSTGSATPPELWGGVECTVVRVGDKFRDQVQETGHADRPGDIDLMAEMGITTTRYPILWEKIAPESLDRLDFSWTDDRLHRLRERGIRVVGGLLHHGSGPRYTSLVDPDFVPKFAEYAARVAERYPWIDTWTPVNEPLTTARFAGLYGHWYPHGHDDRTYLTALANECAGTLEAMQAIRRINPDAKLLQTEDLGKTYSTAPLRYQAAHENLRRWLSFDLLCGKVDAKHPFYQRMVGSGVDEAQLDLLLSGEGRPDMLGINHYLTSERFLDHRVELYPDHQVGGNGRDLYVDAEAVRVKRLHLDTGFSQRLREAWDRYRIPLAITEVHHGCTRDEQLRWFAQVWNEACALRAEGMDLRAVTLWSMFGNVDWRSLLTREDGFYDVGAYDARSPEPRPTAIVQAAKAFARGQAFDHPVLDVPGWWRRPERLYSWNGRCKSLGTDGRKLLITGASGTLGQAFGRIAEHRGLPFCLTSRAELDLTDEASIAAALERHRPWAVINTAGYVRVPEAENDRDTCFAWNAHGAAKLALACQAAGIPLLTFSTDLVFDGGKGGLYVEGDAHGPTTVYGMSKAAAEEAVLAAGGKPLVIRTSAFFGPWDKHNFAHAVLGALGRGESFRACHRTHVSPTYVPDLVHASLDLLIDGETGIWHLANQGEVSWNAFGRMVAEGAGYDPAMVLPIDGAAEHASTAMTSERGILLRPLERAVEDYLRELGEFGRTRQLLEAAE